MSKRLGRPPLKVKKIQCTVRLSPDTLADAKAAYASAHNAKGGKTEVIREALVHYVNTYLSSLGVDR